MIAENSQQADDEAFRDRKIKASDQDLGSRTALEGEEELIWYPAEVNVITSYSIHYTKLYEEFIMVDHHGTIRHCLTFTDIHWNP